MTGTEKPIRVLLVEDEPDHALLFRKMLAAAIGSAMHVMHVGTLKEASESVAADPPDVVLLDLMLPDSQGFDTFGRLHGQSPEVPIIVLSGMKDEELALEAVRLGAQDYLVKGQFEGGLLSRAIRYAIERNRMRQELRSLSLVDELTGLYNRRGFSVLAEQQQKIARRTRRGFLIFFIDMDGLKQINDTHGHAEGDRAIAKAASIIREAFRDSDIIARLAGDEFAVLAVEADTGSAQRPILELRDLLKEANSSKELPYEISLSLGVARAAHDTPLSIEELVHQADASMYDEKRNKRRWRTT
ncbi:MAG TPA: GGDEF domain-containing response regulator [Candidatus Xenobia bacterium]|nr:GGDEF domain-containing response regulator [Candidatus Xenobia bacterium]